MMISTQDFTREECRCASLVTLAIMLAFSLTGCGAVKSGNASSSPSAGSGNVYVFLESASAGAVLAFRASLTNACIVGSAGTGCAPASGTQTVELSHLELAPTPVFTLTHMNATAYSSFTLNIASPDLTVVASDGSISYLTGSTTPAAILATSSITVPVKFTVSSGNISGLMLEFDIAKSITVDASGNYVINPVLSATVLDGSSSETDVVDTVAQVLQVQNSPTPAMNVQLVSNGSVLQFGVNANTAFDSALGQFSALQPGTMIEVNATSQSSGLVASSVMSGPPVPSLAYSGIVTAVQQGTSGGTLDMVVQQ